MNKELELQRKDFFGLKIVNAEWPQWQEELKKILTGKKLQVVMTPNPEQIMLARKDGRFLECLRQADYLIPDGEGLVWAAKLRERLTGADSGQEILKIATEKKLKILLLGGRYQSDDKGQLRIKNGANENVIFYTQGYQNVEKPIQSEEKAVKLLIADIRPEVVLVAFGAPKQEKWLIEHRQFLQENGVRLGMAMGGTFDFLTGKIARAPKSWQKWHLEWLWRLGQEPQRITRQLVLPRYVWLVLTEQIK